ncbi:hypothetical protein Sjap_001379 [Stephania japonica]|uniref:Uncharacterized protein n=1 Tax=Stephania japonica TaxID=461633 RepID=A0AAP0KM50_9MAGN
MEFDRLNCPNTSAITLEVLGHQLQFSQDPNSKHLGTTVWDASMVFVKFLEKNCRKGRFCPSKLKGKRVIELGAGCGVAGFGKSYYRFCYQYYRDFCESLKFFFNGMALLGCDVVSTDQVEVVELDWGNQEHIKAVDPPFDFIIGTDVISGLCGASIRATLADNIRLIRAEDYNLGNVLMLGYEIRSTSVHEQMLEMWKSNFELKTVPKAKMDIKYQHPSIQLYIMESKSRAGSASSSKQIDNQLQNVNGSIKHENNDEDDDGNKSELAECETEEVHPVSKVADLKNGKLSDWEARRYGSLAARLLRDVKIA